MKQYVAIYRQNGVAFARYFQADDLAHAAEQAIDAAEEGEEPVGLAS